MHEHVFAMIERMFGTYGRRRFVAATLSLIIVAVGARAVTPAPAASAAPETLYVVRSGDTLWSIASVTTRSDVRRAVRTIESANGLRGAVLRPGMVLRLPAGA